MRAFLPVLPALLLAVVASPAPALVGSSEPAPAADAGRVVMVLQRQGASAGFCSGIVIGRSAVLTAAHCIPPGADLRVHYPDDGPAPVLRAVAGVVRHPGYRPDAIKRRERSIDLAVVRLAEPLPGRFTPVSVGDAGPVEAGTPFRIAGFGVTREGDGRSSGRLRETTLVARGPLSKLLLWAEDAAHRGRGACTGDSGGPVFDASGVVVALTLWSAGEGNAQCGALTQALWLAPYRDWIDAAAAP